MEPLTRWKCDVCGDDDVTAKDGYVVWKVSPDPDHFYSGHLVIHQGRCDPKEHGDPSYTNSLPLSHFLGPDGMADLLSWLSAGPVKPYQGNVRVKDFDEYVDFVRRVQTPYYEEARPFLTTDTVQNNYSDSNEYLPYMTEELKAIATKGRGGLTG